MAAACLSLQPILPVAPLRSPCPDSVTSNLNWFCVHTKPRREEALAAYCRDTLGLETYFPRVRGHRTIRRVRRLVTAPLFPRYVFCRFNAATSFRAVRYAPDALDVIHRGSIPAAVDDRLIAELQAWAGEAVDIISLHPPLKPGDAVDIVDGPMRGLSATIVQCQEDRDRVALLLSILTSEAQVNIPREHLRRRD
jgi:transcriptional antiterminator RfaH